MICGQCNTEFKGVMNEFRANKFNLFIGSRIRVNAYPKSIRPCSGGAIIDLCSAECKEEFRKTVIAAKSALHNGKQNQISD